MGRAAVRGEGCEVFEFCSSLLVERKKERINISRVCRSVHKVVKIVKVVKGMGRNRLIY